MNNAASFLFSDDNTAALYQNQQNCGGLARFRSVPSSFLATFLDSGNESNGGSVEESETILSNLMNRRGAMKQEIDVSMEQRNGSYSVGVENATMDSGNHSNLARQTSSASPAGFFNGFGVMGEVGNYRMSNCPEANSQASDLTNPINYSFDTTPSSRFMPGIPGNGNQCSFENVNGVSSREYAPTLLKDSWNDVPFNSLKRNRDDDLKTYSNFNGLMGNENGKTINSATCLTHHLSLPKVPSQVASVENFLQFQEDAVPRQIRAKRGCATHPRSIAERMRRTRISERMKKLQDLCPNMDKQMNTAHMLDMAVDYIKELQEQVQKLTDKKAKCRCPSNIERYANLIP